MGKMLRYTVREDDLYGSTKESISNIPEKMIIKK
jgi:hypothetical protein